MTLPQCDIEDYCLIECIKCTLLRKYQHSSETLIAIMTFHELKHTISAIILRLETLLIRKFVMPFKSLFYFLVRLYKRRDLNNVALF
jgi:hypothetical protein